MKREFLEKLGLGKDAIDKIMAENGKDIEAEKSKLTTKDGEIEVLNAQLKETNKTIKSYKDMNIDEIKESAREWESKYKNAQKEIVEIKNNATLEKALAEAGSVDPELLGKILDRDTLKFTDEGVTGLKEQIENLKESKPYLFKETDPSGENKPDGKQGQDDRFNAHNPPDPSGGGVSALEAAISSVFNE